jgi:addiction module HigA family antidote
MEWDKKRVIVTGAGGFIGSHLVERLVELEAMVRALVRNNNGRRAITGDTALRLGHFFGTSPEFWVNLQKIFELRLAQDRSWAIIKILPTLSRARKEPGAVYFLFSRVQARSLSSVTNKGRSSKKLNEVAVKLGLAPF